LDVPISNKTTVHSPLAGALKAVIAITVCAGCKPKENLLGIPDQCRA